VHLIFPKLLLDGLIIASIGLLILAALHDVAARIVPNWICLTLTLLGLGARADSGTFIYSLILSAFVFFVAAFCWRRGWMGGGDVKLLGAAATLVAPAVVLSMVTLVAFAGGGLAVIYLILRKTVTAVPALRPAPPLLRILRAEAWRIRRGAPLPYACAIAAGAIIALFQAGA
jgi:prepilin peptidase CpaA